MSFRLARAALAAACAAACLAAPAFAEPWVWIKNRWQADTYLNTQPGYVTATDVEDAWHSGQWTFEPAGQFFRIRNRWKGCYLHIERGAVECTRIQAGWHSAQWKAVDTPDGWAYLQNRWKSCYLNVERGPVQCTGIQRGWQSAMWTIEE